MRCGVGAGRYVWEMSPPKDRISDEILRLCDARGRGKTVCPSEVARALEAEEAEWRALMPEVREVAAGLARAGRIAIYRKGEVVDDHDTGGVIRLGLPPDQALLRRQRSEQ